MQAVILIIMCIMLVWSSQQIPAKANKLVLSYLFTPSSHLIFLKGECGETGGEGGGRSD